MEFCPVSATIRLQRSFVRRSSVASIKRMIECARDIEVKNPKYIPFLQAFLEYRQSLDDYQTICLIGISPAAGVSALNFALKENGVTAILCPGTKDLRDSFAHVPKDSVTVIAVFETEDQLIELWRREWQDLLKGMRYLLVCTKAEAKSYREVLLINSEVKRFVSRRRIFHVSAKEKELFDFNELVSELRSPYGAF